MNLTVLPLDGWDAMIPQKCVVPCPAFPKGVRTADLVKCLMNDGHFAVAKIYPRTGFIRQNSCCYLDATVSNSPIDDWDEQRSVIGFEKLTKATARHLTLIFTLTPKVFDNFTAVTLSSLKNIFMQQCLALKLTTNCIVRMPALLKKGIAAIHIKALLECESDGNHFFIIDDTISITIENVRLQSPFVEKKHFLCGNENDIDILYRMTCGTKKDNLLSKKSNISNNVLIIGPSGSGKNSIVTAFIRDHNVNCFKIIPSDMFNEYPGETEAKLAEIFRAAKVFRENLKPKDPTVIYIKDLHILCPKEASTDNFSMSERLIQQITILIDELYNSYSDIMVLATAPSLEDLDKNMRDHRRFASILEVPELDDSKRLSLFRSIFDDSFIKKQMNMEIPHYLLKRIAVHSSRFNVGQLCRLVQEIGHILLEENNGKISNAVNRALKMSHERVDNSNVVVYHPKEGFDSIGGMDKLKKILKGSILNALKHSSAFQRFGLRLPKGVLLYGPPGCAKTTIAKCLAKEANMGFISASNAEVYSPYVGCTEQYISKLFDVARRNAPCIIFLDEIDALVGNRSTRMSSNPKVNILSTLLVEMDGIISTDSHKQILIVAATNRPDMVDDALLRPGRFDKLIHVPAPDYKCRLAILELISKTLLFEDDVDFRDIAKRTANFSGADLRFLCNEAALMAFMRDQDTCSIIGEDIELALSSQKPSLTTDQIKAFEDMEANGSFHIVD